LELFFVTVDVAVVVDVNVVVDGFSFRCGRATLGLWWLILLQLLNDRPKQNGIADEAT
jgi:hypothetical protein